jgi:hypothetical protein
MIIIKPRFLKRRLVCQLLAAILGLPLLTGYNEKICSSNFTSGTHTAHYTAEQKLQIWLHVAVFQGKICAICRKLQTSSLKCGQRRQNLLL